MGEPWRSIRLYWLLQRATVRATMQYRLNALISVVTGAVFQGSGFAFIWVVMNTFPSLAGWTLPEIAFLYGLRLTAHALWMIPFSALIGLEFLVREGEFDRFLLRPLNPLVQLMTKRMGIGQVGDLAVGVALLVIAAQSAGVAWSPLLIGFCALALVGGALVEAAIFLALSSLSLRMLDTFALRVFVDDVFSSFGSYPMKIFGGATQWFLTFVVPVAFVAYVPASVMLGKTDGLSVSPAVAAAAPLLGVALFACAYLFWTRQMRHYQSVGH